MNCARLVVAAALLSMAFYPAAGSAQETLEDNEQQADEAAAQPPVVTRTPSRARTVVRLHSGFSLLHGDYGRTSSTDVYYVPLSLRVQHGGWRARVSTSFIAIDGPATIIDAGSGDAEVVGQDPANNNETRSGLGDLSLQVGRRFDLADNTRLTASARIKFPTASESQRLTTGTTDVTLRAQVSQRVGDVTLRAGARRRFAGGDGRVQLRDTWGLNTGATVNLGDGLAVGADYSWLQSSYGNAPNSSAMAWVSVPVSRRVRLTGYGGTGLSSNSADVQVGASVSLRID